MSGAAKEKDAENLREMSAEDLLSAFSANVMQFMKNPYGDESRAFREFDKELRSELLRRLSLPCC